jgi:branched-chain amino acid transport system substrate-binding protein
MTRTRILLLLGWLLGVLLLAGCGAAADAQNEAPPTRTPGTPALHHTHPATATIDLPPVAPANVTGDIISAGSSTVFPLAQLIAEEFEAEGYPGPGQITIDSIGSGAGFERFCVQTEIDISNASRPIRPEERASCQQNGRDPLAFRLGTQALAVTVSTDNDFVQDVTLAELAEIFSTAETWQDVRPEWPPEPILRYVPGTDSGTFDYFVEQVFDEDPEPLLNASNLQLSENNTVLRQGVEASPFSVGVFGYAYYSTEPEQMRALALDGTAPTLQTVEAVNYPLARPLYMYSDAGIMQRKPQVAAFLNYALTNVNDLIGDVDYTQATTATLNQAKQTWLDAMAQDVFNERVYLPLVQRGGGAAASATIKIAVQSPLSGPQATVGTGIRNAAELAMQQQAALLTDLGFTVELVPYDDESQPERGVANANIITADPEVRCVVGHLNSGVALAALPFYQDANLLMVSPATTNPRITDDFTNTLRLVGHDDAQGAAAARFTHEHLDVQSVYIIHDQTSYGRGIAQIFWQRSETYDLDVLAFESTQEQSVFDSVITPIQAARPDLVYFSGIYDQAGRFFAQARDRGIEAVFMGPEGLNNSTLLDAGGSAVDGLYYTTTTAPAAFYPQAAAFAQDYQRIYETLPPTYAAQAYDATGICIQTIAQAAQDVNGAPTRAQVLATVRDLETYQGMTGSYTFTAQGDPTTTTYYVWQVDAANWADNTLVMDIPVAFPLSTEHVPRTPDPTPTATPTPTPSPTPTPTRPTSAFLRDAAFIDEQCGWLVHGVGNDCSARTCFSCGPCKAMAIGSTDLRSRSSSKPCR